MIRTRAWRPLAGGLVAMVAVACSTGAAATPGLTLEGRSWRAVDIASHPPVGGNEPTIAFMRDHIRGSGGCNTFSGSWTLTDGRLDVEGIRATLKACEGAIGDREREYLRALVSAERVAIEADGTLIVEGAGGALRFVVDDR